MAVEHELHQRRFSRNLGVGLTLAAFVAIVFGLTLSKVKRGDDLEAFDHTPATVFIDEETPAAGGNN